MDGWCYCFEFFAWAVSRREDRPINFLRQEYKDIDNGVFQKKGLAEKLLNNMLLSNIEIQWLETKLRRAFGINESEVNNEEVFRLLVDYTLERCVHRCSSGPDIVHASIFVARELYPKLLDMVARSRHLLRSMSSKSTTRRP